MDKYGYILKKQEEKIPDKRYRKAELELKLSLNSIYNLVSR